ncbi:hypothetical protein PCANC_12129, partial [Puccinia coronata f. sp. avenae]
PSDLLRRVPAGPPRRVRVEPIPEQPTPDRPSSGLEFEPTCHLNRNQLENELEGLK